MPENKPDLRTALQTIADRRQDSGPHPDLEDLVAYHAGELAAVEEKRLQDHLVWCPECARLVLDLDTFAISAAREVSEPAIAPVVPIAPRRPVFRRRWVTAIGAVAAAIALFIAWPRVEPLPGYAPSFSGDVRTVRDAGEASEIPVFVEGRELEIKLLPETTVVGRVTARAYLRLNAELRTLSAATLEIENGLVSLSGVLGADLHLPVGDHHLALVVARRGELPSLRRLHAALTSETTPTGSGWVAIQSQIRVVESPGDGEPALESEPWIEFAGCRTVRVGPVCVLGDDRRLTLWIRHRPGAEVKIDVGDWRPRQLAAGTAVRDGFRYAIELEPDARELVVEVTRSGRRSVWALALEPADTEAQWLSDARRAMQLRDLETARALAQPRLGEPDPAQRGAAFGLLARIAQRSDRPAVAVDHFLRAAEAQLEAGRLLDAVNDSTAAVYQLLQDRRFTDAAEVLEDLPVAHLGGAAEGRYYANYWRGLYSEETGDLRAAMSAMALASRGAERTGLLLDQIYSDDMLARQLSTVGLADAAAELHAGIRSRMAQLCPSDRSDVVPRAPGSETLDVCVCARLLTSRAWTWLLALEAGRPADDPSPPLQEAERLLEWSIANDGEKTCVMAEDLPNVRFNLALAALVAGDAERAQDDLARAAVDPQTLPRLAMWQLDLKARIALANARPTEALDLYRDLERRADPDTSPEAAWRAAFGRATAFAALGQTGEAADACGRAEDLLDTESLMVPMHAGRELFLAQRQKAARFCLDLLLTAGRQRQALATARRSVARSLRSLRLDAGLADLDPQARALWAETTARYRTVRDEIEGIAGQIRQGLPRDQQQRLESEINARRRALRELLDQRVVLLGGHSAFADGGLAEPPPGTLLLVYHPLPQGWAAFATDRQGVAVHRLELDSGEFEGPQLAVRLLEPFAERITRAQRVEVIAAGALRAVDFHVLPFADGMLLDHAPVAYRLDLPEIPAEAVPSPASALVVTDPGLLAAPAEGRQVRSLLESRSWRVELLEGPSASEPEVRRQLAGATLFHYAGHADFDRDSRGWDSRLALARGRGLTVDDVLAAPGVPRWVVLSGCETGRESRAAPLPSVGLAQAFLVAGSEAVVAATSEVSDREAAAMAEAFYRHWEAPVPLAVALRKAQLERSQQAPDSDWLTFRVIAR